MESEEAATVQATRPRRVSRTPVTDIETKKRGRKPKNNDESQTPFSQQKSQKATFDDKYSQWKTLLPILYDSFANHTLVWPSLSCRWGPQLEQAASKTQRLYLSEQTNGSVPNTLVIANCEAVNRQLNEEGHSPFVKKYKTIIHPGEVNRIRDLPQNSKIVATHTDSPDVLIWDTDTQPDRHAVLGAPHSRPDLLLAGHQDNAEFALAMCSTEPFVLSGGLYWFYISFISWRFASFYWFYLCVILFRAGKDKSVVLWSIQDHVTMAGTDSKSPGSSFKQTGEGSNKIGGPSIDPRGVYHGHEDTVEDVAFCPSSAQEFCSVGDDSCLMLWDARTGTGPAMKVEKAHDADVHCVDWNPHDNNLILTGSADNTIRVFDRRNLTSNGVGSPIYTFEGHKTAVLCVQWSPDKSSVFGSSAEDGLLNIWDYDRVGKKSERSPKIPAGLFFQHAGHRDKVVDFNWNVLDPWTIVSVSDNFESSGGGGTLQIWRMSDLIYRPEDEVLTELEKFKSHVFTCTSKP